MPPETDSITFHLSGRLAQSLQAVTDHWLLTAPDANPAMLEVFSDRDTLPYRDQMPWVGEFAGKYLTSAVQVLRLTADNRLRDHLATFVQRLISRQDSDGYLGPWPQDARLANHSYHHTHPETPPEAGLATWDTWGHYHVMLGLLLWDETVGDPDALEATSRMADLICEKYLGEASPRLVETGFSEMNLAPAHSLAMLYRRTGDPRHLAMAQQIIDEFGATTDDGEPLAGDYYRLALEGKEFYEMPRPRWESLHPIMALAELYAISGEEGYHQAFEHIWWSIRNHDRHNNGGFSSGEQATGNPYDPRAIETCCTIAWTALSVEMLKLKPDPRVADELEMTLLNSILGMHHPSGRWATYNTPSDGIRLASAHQIVFQARSGSPELNCCSVNSPRGLGALSDWALATSQGAVHLNYYGSGSISVLLADGVTFEIVQDTRYPLDAKVLLTLNPSRPLETTLNLRIPAWSQNTRVSVNSESQPAPTPGTYLPIFRLWQPGDTIEMELDFTPRFWVGERDCLGKASIYRGPLLLAYDLRYNHHLAEESRREHQTYGQDPWKDPGRDLRLPTFDLENLQFASAAWDDWLPPDLLLAVEIPGGQTAYLCDFASAGQTGSPYHSWLPILKGENQ